ncbi:MAG: polysaccharide biosynthesis/export family protein [Pirellulales bacterium]
MSAFNRQLELRNGHIRVCLTAALAIWLAGCRTPADTRGNITGPTPTDVARELDYVNLPTYRIEPPDILLIDALRVVPREPFRIESNDYIYVQATGTLPDQPISGAILVDPSGFIDLGAAYGKVKVAGNTMDEASEVVEKHLARTLREPQVAITLARSGGQQQIIGEHIVGPDGRITMGKYGGVYVAGMTVAEANAAVSKHLERYLQDPVIAISVASYNSKVYYVVSEGANQGDNIVRVPITGKETVLDAIVAVGGVSRLNDSRIWVARPNPGIGCDQILPVNYGDVVKGGNPETNFQLMAGDRVFIADNRYADFDGALERLLSPIQTVMNFTLLGTNTIQTVNRFPRGGNFGNFQ